MPKYQTRHRVIEAIQWDEKYRDDAQGSPLPAWFLDALLKMVITPHADGSLRVRGFEMLVKEKDWIIRREDGTIEPVSFNEFGFDYEPYKEPPQPSPEEAPIQGPKATKNAQHQLPSGASIELVYNHVRGWMAYTVIDGVLYAGRHSFTHSEALYSLLAMNMIETPTCPYIAPPLTDPKKSDPVSIDSIDLSKVTFTTKADPDL